MFLDKFKRRTALGLIAAFAAFSFSSPLAFAEDKTKIKLGVMDGEEGDVWKVAVKEAKKQGLDIELVYFSDYAIPNEAVSAGELDANAFQHKPYLDAQIEQRGFKLSIAGYTALFPVGVYSHKIKSLDELPEGAEVGIPNDPSNEGRALLALQGLGIIKLKDVNNIMATPLDIAENPKKLKFRELDASLVGGAIDDLTISVINTNFALQSGLNPEKDVIAWEKAEGNPYNNIIVVRTEDLDKPWVKKLVASYNNETVRAELKRIFGSTYATSW